MHRAVGRPRYVDEVEARFGISMPRYVTWDDVRAEMLAPVGGAAIDEVEPQSGHATYTVNAGRSVVRVVSGGEAERGVFPGDGDVWSVEVRSSPRRW